MNNGETMIEVKNLTKHYESVRALDDISFSVRRGEVLGFLGPNGAGKTTTMKILTCFIAPTKGSVTVAGNDIYKNSLDIRRKIGYLPENAPLYTDMQVREYLDFVCDIRRIPRTDKKKAMNRVLEQCGLEAAVMKEIRALSKGYRQRVGLAQALIHEPEILILDEPTSGLDPNQIVEIRELIKSIGKERTVILSTHNLAEVQASAQRVLIIHYGKLVADGKIDELESQRGGTQYNVVMVRPSDSLEAVKQAFSDIPGVKSVGAAEAPSGEELALSVQGEVDKDVRADIFRKAVERSWTLLELSGKRVDLESIFREVTVAEEPYQAA